MSGRTRAPWIRTRWDRLQATALVAGIALAGSMPTWLLAAIIMGGMK